MIEVIDYVVFSVLTFSVIYSTYKEHYKTLIGLIGITLAYIIVRFK